MISARPAFKPPGCSFHLVFLSYIFGVMPYRRRAYRRGRYGSRDKYSVHQKAFSFTAQASPTTTAQLIVPSSATEGMRKVKHLTVNLTPILDQDGGQIWWALVYVPQGTTAGSIQLATTAALSDMYEPNQYVMNCGIVDPTAGPIRFQQSISLTQPQQRRRNRPSRPSHSWWQHGHPCTCRYAITLSDLHYTSNLYFI